MFFYIIMLMTFYINIGWVFNNAVRIWVIKSGRCEDLIENRINRWGKRYEGEEYVKEGPNKGKQKKPQILWLNDLRTIHSIQIGVRDKVHANDIEKDIRMYKKDISLKEGRDYPNGIWLDGMTEICRWTEEREKNMVEKMKSYDIPF